MLDPLNQRLKQDDHHPISWGIPSFSIIPQSLVVCLCSTGAILNYRTAPSGGSDTANGMTIVILLNWDGIPWNFNIYYRMLYRAALWKDLVSICLWKLKDKKVFYREFWVGLWTPSAETIHYEQNKFTDQSQIN